MGKQNTHVFELVLKKYRNALAFKQIIKQFGYEASSRIFRERFNELATPDSINIALHKTEEEIAARIADLEQKIKDGVK